MADDLTCPTCMGIFQNPVLLSCGHSSCSECLRRWWEEKRSQDCPVCRARCSSSQPPKNLALRNLCEAFLLERGRKQEVVGPKGKLAVLKLRLDRLGQAQVDYAKISDHAKAQTRNTERRIKAEFRALRRFLEEDEEARITDLRKEEERLSRELRERAERVSLEMTALSETIRTTEEALGDEDAPWQQCQVAIDKAMSKMAEEQSVVGALGDIPLIDVAKHLGNLRYRVWQRMKTVAPFHPVVLDPNTAGNLLSVSEDLTMFREGEGDQRLPETRDRLSFLSVLGSEGYVSGGHSWDVHVGESKCWGVGVIERPPDGGQLREMDSWRLVNGFFGLMALGPDYEGVALPGLGGTWVTRIRLELDLRAGLLTFTDLDSQAVLHKVRHVFRGKVYPYFYNWDQHEIRLLPREPVCTGEGVGTVPL